MRIWPSIDLKNGKCVRLAQGDFHRETVYGSNPADMAARWESEGATGLHIVDLDGALTGRPVNRDAISQIAHEVKIDLEIGGGVRDEKTIDDYLSMGIKRLIIGTRSVSDPDWIESVANRYDGHLLIAIDSRNERVVIGCRKDESGITAIEHAQRMSALPVAGLIYTDVAKTGFLTGSTLPVLEKIKQSTDAPIMAGGGISTAENIIQLASIGINGCVIGRALYEGRLTMPEALAASRSDTEKENSRLPI